MQFKPTLKRRIRSFSHRLTNRAKPRGIGQFERLEPRLTLSASSIDGRPYIDLGPSDNVALDQPRVTVELINSNLESLGPSIFATWLLDTGANSTLTFQSAVNEMNQTPPFYQVEGQYAELGVGGTQLFDISAPYRFDFAGYDGIRQTLLNTRILSDATRDLSLFGPWGIKGMPAMTERYTTLDFTGWMNPDLTELFMKTSFPEQLPAAASPRYTLSVDNRVSFSTDGHIISGNHPPIWADLPFFGAQVLNNANLSSGNFLFDTGAQVSILSSRMALELGLDSNLDGKLDENDAQFARMETVGGVGGMTTVPVFLIDEVHIPTDQGPDLVWTDLQWLVLDIVEGIDGVFGFDNVTSGWIEAFFSQGEAGYIMKSHFDFDGWNTTGEGKMHFDLNPQVHAVVNPNGPGAVVIESGDSTVVSEAGHNDTYTIRLNQQPTANVSISLVTPLDKNVAGLASNPSQTVLQFTPSNWNQPQTVRVSAVDDAVQQSFHRGFVRHVSTSADPAYNAVGMPRVVVNIVDNDFPAVMVLHSNGETAVTEAGQTDSYQLVLTYPPSQNVSIALEHLAGQITAVNAANGTGSLVFTPSNWNVPQSVLVSAVDDSLVEGLHKAWVTHIISTNDEGYQQAFALQATAFISDNDIPAPPPKIQDVILSSSQWNSAMIDAVDGGGVGSGNGLGYSLVGSHQLSNITWQNIDRIHVLFSDDVSDSFNPSKVALVGTNTSNYIPSASLSFGSAGTNVGTIQLSQPITSEPLVLAFSQQMQNGSGIGLDGEWVDGVSTQSGNGTAGGQFNFRINILTGDIDSGGLVNFADISASRGMVGTSVNNSQVARFDVNTDGTITFADLSAIRQRVGTSLPAPPAPPGFGGGNGGGGGSFNFVQSPERIDAALRMLGLLGKDAASLPVMNWNTPPAGLSPFVESTSTLSRTLPTILAEVEKPLRFAIVDQAVAGLPLTNIADLKKLDRLVGNSVRSPAIVNSNNFSSDPIITQLLEHQTESQLAERYQTTPDTNRLKRQSVRRSLEAARVDLIVGQIYPTDESHTPHR